MALPAGTRVGPYEVLAAIGAGGMGEVYRARDTKLNRDVAIKVLPPMFAADPERLARFGREAQVLASLNHPNIAQVHGLEESGETRAIVMELVEGEDLAQRLARGPLPLSEGLAIAKQIAEALEAAHDLGIIHRDLKPANIRVRNDGTVKVLDFGLAKALDPGVPFPSNVTDSPTLSLHATQAGLILGTAAYMAPEQAAARPVDKRADIWSFGVVLWEILVGRSLFGGGETVSHVLADVLRAPVDFEAVPPGPLRHLVRRCLDRDVKTRLRDIGEARIALAQPTHAEPAKTANQQPSSIVTGALVAALALVTAFALWSSLRPVLPPTRPILRFTDTAAVANVPGALALSRDGTRLAFVDRTLGQIHVRSFDQAAPVAIPKTNGARNLCFSPDGQWISYLAGQTPATSQLMKVAVAGGSPQKLADAPALAGPRTQRWSDDGAILFNVEGALVRIGSNGGPVETLARPDEKNNEQYLSNPQLLPDGKNVLLNAGNGLQLGGNRIVALNLQSLERKVLLERAVMAQYVPSVPGSLSGHVVFYDPSSGALSAVGFDARRLEMSGTPVTIIEGVRGVNSYFGTFSISDSGTLAYVPGASLTSPERTLVWVDRQGIEQTTGAPTRQYNIPRLSPDGSRVAVETQNQDPVSIWVYDFDRSTFSRLTTERSISPVWTPDGTRIVYGHGGPTAGEPGRLAMVSADRSGPPTLLGEVTGMIPSSVSPDGQTVIGAQTRSANIRDGDSSLIAVPLSGVPAKPRLWLTSPFRKSSAVFSPDGRWVAYQSDDSGRSEVYVTAYPGPGATTPVSNDGGNNPRWSRDGRELFYRSGARMVAVNVELTPVFRASRPETLFEFPYGTGFDVAPDGKRFLMIKNIAAASAGEANQLNIVVNWTEELKARVPTLNQ